MTSMPTWCSHPSKVRLPALLLQRTDHFWFAISEARIRDLRGTRGWRRWISRTFHGISVGGNVISKPAATQYWCIASASPTQTDIQTPWSAASSLPTRKVVVLVPRTRLPEVLRWLHERAVVVRDCQVKDPELEEVFVELAR